jgi:hypothetical protein
MGHKGMFGLHLVLDVLWSLAFVGFLLACLSGF